MAKVSYSLEELENISMEYMTKKGYNLKTKSENQLVFTGGRDINNTILLLSFLIFFVGGLLYYFLSKTHTISIEFVKLEDGLNVNVFGSTQTSGRIAENFMESLLTFDKGAHSIGFSIQEIKCPRCSSSLDYLGEKIVKCSFCGASIAINEKRK
jgi:hypothetical protein